MRWLTSEAAWLRARGAAELTLAFALGTFQSCLLVLVSLVAVFLTGELGGQIEDLDTLTGLGLFLLLWIPTTYFTLCAVVQIGLARLREGPGFTMVLYGLKWGALGGRATALAFGSVFLAGVTVSGLMTAGPITSVLLLALGLLGIVFGGVLAMVLGALFGLAAGLIEAPLVYLARAVAGAGPVDGARDSRD